MVRIRIANKKRGGQGEYVGRPSPLGNPYPLEHEGEREQVVEQFARWLERRLEAGDVAVKAELNRLYRLALERGEVTLVCWCSPRRCHAEVIGRRLKAALEGRGREAVVEYV